MGFSWKAMWANKCPRCRQGSIFTEPFKISDPLDMPKSCTYCGQRTEPEPGFYFGAMFASYILSSWFLLLPTLLLVFYFKWSVFGAVTFTLVLASLTYLRFARGSRSLWLHMNVAYDPEVAEEVGKEIEEKKTKSQGPYVPPVKS